MTFELLCMALIALLFGAAVCFNGYRWFLLLLPIFGFFFGFMLGAQTLQAIFGIGFVANVTSWIVGFIVGLVFAVLSYLFYMIGVALVAGWFGYALGVGVLGAIGLNFGFLVWLIAVILGIVVAVVTIALNIQKWVIIFITSVGGATVIAGTLGLMFSGQPVAVLGQNPARSVIQSSPLLIILFLVLAVLGFIGQLQINRDYVLEAPEDRW